MRDLTTFHNARADDSHAESTSHDSEIFYISTKVLWMSRLGRFFAFASNQTVLHRCANSFYFNLAKPAHLNGRLNALSGNHTPARHLYGYILLLPTLSHLASVGRLRREVISPAPSAAQLPVTNRLRTTPSGAAPP